MSACATYGCKDVRKFEDNALSINIINSKAGMSFKNLKIFINLSCNGA